MEAGLVEFARRPPATVTVADIARAASMTPTAVYYHFPSKSDLLEELVRVIGSEYVEMTALTSDGDLAAQQAASLERFIRWVDAHPDKARLYFVTSPGVSPGVEALRRVHLAEAVRTTASSLVAARPGLDLVEAYVMALALATVFAESAVARLEDGQQRDHVAAALEVCARICGEV